MYSEVESPEACADIKTFVRNRYFYGKLLEVSHFETEQAYFNEKRWLLNRLVTGYGVVCGLNVGLTEDNKQIWVDTGVAIDKSGHEIIVPVRSKPKSLPVPEPETTGDVKEGTRDDDDDDDDDARVVSVYICYHDCPGDPEPILANDCETPAPCATGSIRERYTIDIRPGKAPKIDLMCEVPDVMMGGRLNYKLLAEFVTSSCPPVHRDPCIALANIRLPQSGNSCCADDIDISVRPIVYSNDLLFELLLGLTSHNQNRPKGGKH
jgi:hypothetical protein